MRKHLTLGFGNGRASALEVEGRGIASEGGSARRLTLSSAKRTRPGQRPRQRFTARRPMTVADRPLITA